jgi:hypothetical protein
VQRPTVYPLTGQAWDVEEKRAHNDPETTGA